MILNDYKARCKQQSDINELMPVLFNYAKKSSVIVEFGVRSGNSTCAFLAGLDGSRGKLYSYDIEEPKCKFTDHKWSFSIQDTSKLDEIPNCDLFFIDTLHTADQVTAELKHSGSVKRFILLHDTMLFGDKGEGGGYGITHAIYCFLRDNPDWRIKDHLPHNNGLLILERS